MCCAGARAPGSPAPGPAGRQRSAALGQAVGGPLGPGLGAWGKRTCQHAAKRPAARERVLHRVRATEQSQRPAAERHAKERPGSHPRNLTRLVPTRAEPQSKQQSQREGEQEPERVSEYRKRECQKARRPSSRKEHKAQSLHRREPDPASPKSVFQPQKRSLSPEPSTEAITAEPPPPARPYPDPNTLALCTGRLMRPAPAAGTAWRPQPGGPPPPFPVPHPPFCAATPPLMPLPR